MNLGLVAGRFGPDIAIDFDFDLDGEKNEAMAAVPDQLVDEIALLGPRERIAERVEAWKASPANSMLLGAGRPEALRTLAELVL